MKHKITQQIICLLLLLLPISQSQAEELVVFGNFRGSFNSIDDPICQGNCTEQSNTDQEGISFRNNASILGLRGSITQDDLTGYFKYIMRAHNDEIFSNGAVSTIIYTAGFKGKWGDLGYGVGSTPYKTSGMKLDPFWDTSGSARGFDGPSIGLSDLTWGFSKNMLQWNSQQIFDNITLDAAIIIDDSNEDKHDINIGARYNYQALSFGLQHLQLEESKATAKSPGKGNATRLWASYKQENWDIAFSVENISQEQRANQQYYFVSSNIFLTEKVKIALSYGDSDIPDDIALNGSGGSLGIFYHILPKTQIYSLINIINRDDIDDRKVFAIGFIHNFDFKFTK